MIIVLLLHMMEGGGEGGMGRLERVGVVDLC